MRPLPVGVSSAGSGTAAGENIKAPSPEEVSVCEVCEFVVGFVSTTCARSGKTATIPASKIKNARQYPLVLTAQDRHLPMKRPRFSPGERSNNRRPRQSYNNAGPATLRCRFALKRFRRDLTAATAAETIVQDRKSTRLNSSHSQISYAVFCLQK